MRAFTNESFGEVRTLVIDGEAWFIAADVCRALEIKNPSHALIRLDDDEKMTLVSNEGHSGKRGGAQSFNAVNEPGLYSLVLSSRKSEARAFKRWVTHEIIPSIRKHGMYATDDVMEQLLNNPDHFVDMVVAYRDARKAQQALEEQAAINAPKVRFAECVETSHQSILVGELAKLMRQNGVQIGQNRLFALLRDEGYLCSATGERWNMPTQRSMELGLFEIKKRMLEKTDGSLRLIRTTTVTGKGQIYFMDRYLTNEVMAQNIVDAE